LTRPLKLTLGVKTDPIEYRYSYEWLFRLMAEEGVRHAQIGSFFEIYQLPDDYFVELRRTADKCGVTIASVFTAHRELGGFFQGDPRWEKIARANYERLIVAGALMGARSVGSNPGAVMRDRMETKPAGIACYIRHIKELMAFAKTQGVECLTIEPMSCLAEPPTLPDEIRAMCEELMAHHRAKPQWRAAIGCCTDVSHGYADRDGVVKFDNMRLLEDALPWTTELHLKNTDKIFNSTFGFSPAERERGIVDLAVVRDLILRNAEKLPVSELIGYLEIGGPKTGRDYSDGKLEQQLRESLRYARETFAAHGQE